MPMRLPAEVAGSLSRLQGQLMEAQPHMQQAAAMHWLAMRQAGGIPAFQQMTQHMLWGIYGTTALRGFLNQALSGRSTPDVMGGLIDQVNLVRQSFSQAADTLQQVLGEPEVQQMPVMRPMVRSFRPLDQVYQAVQQPMQTVTTGLAWTPGATVPMVTMPQAMVQPAGLPAQTMWAADPQAWGGQTLRGTDPAAGGDQMPGAGTEVGP